ncbi:MAG: methyl-accepting chemotaxis protein [Cellulosilyticaceae bacterium]
MINKLLSLPIGKRNITGFCSLILLLLFIAIAALSSLTLLARHTELLYEKPYHINHYAWSIRNNLNTLEKEMYKVITTTGSGSILQSTADLLSSIQKLRLLLSDNPDALSILDQLETHVKELRPLQENILTASLEGNQNTALAIVSQSYLPLIKKAYACSDHLSLLSTQIADDFLQTSYWVKTSVIGFILLLTALSIWAAFYISILITKSIIIPLKQFETILQQFSKGNLSLTIPYHHTDEISNLGHCLERSIASLQNYVSAISESLANLACGQLHTPTTTHYEGDFSPIGDSISHIAASLRFILQDILESSHQITHYAQEVYTDAHSLAQTASKQVAISETLFGALSGIAKKADANAFSAASIHQTAKETTTLACLGTKKIDTMTQAIDAITHASTAIEKIVSSISGIAHQSHLLSLNASIEAARVGDAGHGFSVIASEMQHLSHRSRQAAKETSSLIENVLLTTQSGATTIHETSETLSQIITSVQSSQGDISTIVLTSEEQSLALQEVVISLRQMTDTSRTTSTFASNTLMIIEKLISRSEELKSHLSQFNWS